MDSVINVRRKILIVDDEEMNRELLRHIFEQTYEIETAVDGRQAVEKVARYKDELAVILLDLMMPMMNGYQVLQVLAADNIMEKIPVILISVNTDIRITLSCYSLGAVDVISKPFINDIVRRRVDNVVKMYQKDEMLEARLVQSNEMISRREKQLYDFYDKFLETISNIIEFRDTETSNHIKRVRGLTQIVATTYKNLYPEDGLTQENVNEITRLSTLHDIGKIAIPDSILLKPGRLTDAERDIMKSHTTKGCDILSEIDNVKDLVNYEMAYNIIRYHHERYDGNGYPDGLVGDEIPLEAQIVSIADVYDVLVNERVYKKAYSTAKAYEIMSNGECGKFSPKMLKCVEYARKVLEIFSDTH